MDKSGATSPLFNAAASRAPQGKYIDLKNNAQHLCKKGNFSRERFHYYFPPVFEKK